MQGRPVQLSCVECSREHIVRAGHAKVWRAPVDAYLIYRIDVGPRGSEEAHAIYPAILTRSVKWSASVLLYAYMHGCR
jgi:hypothetical protein